jgi:hypothetical protein
MSSTIKITLFDDISMEVGNKDPYSSEFDLKWVTFCSACQDQGNIPPEYIVCVLETVPEYIEAFGFCAICGRDENTGPSKEKND